MPVDIKRLLVTEIPETDKKAGGYRGFEAAVREVFDAMDVGQMTTRTNIGKYLDRPMLRGTTRNSGDNIDDPTVIRFNGIKRKLVKQKVISVETRGTEGNYEYYFTKLTPKAEMPATPTDSDESDGDDGSEE